MKIDFLSHWQSKLEKETNITDKDWIDLICHVNKALSDARYSVLTTVGLHIAKEHVYGGNEHAANYNLAITKCEKIVLTLRDKVTP